VALLKPRAKILEVGGGCLRNALFLLRRGFRITVLELPATEAIFPREYQRFRAAGGSVCFTALPRNARYDLALICFVVETMCRPDARVRLLRLVRKHLARPGHLIMSVRGPADLVTAVLRGSDAPMGS